MVLESVEKTGRCLVVHEAPTTGGFGGEVAAVVARDAFAWLDAPVERLGALDTPVPAAQALEEIFSPKARLLPALRALLEDQPRSCPSRPSRPSCRHLSR